MRSLGRALVALCIVPLVVASCTSTGPGDTTGGGQPAGGGRIVAAETSDIKTLNPVLSSDVPSSTAWTLVYVPLTQANSDNAQIEPFLAEKFGLSQDGLTLTYALRDGLVWSDGVPFTGEDYKYTAEAVMRSKRTVRKNAFDNVVGAKDYQDGKTDTIGGIQVKDGGKTIEIKFTKTFCPAVAALGGAGAGGIIPKHHFVKVWDNKTTDTGKNIDDNPLNLAPPPRWAPSCSRSTCPGTA